MRSLNQFDYKKFWLYRRVYKHFKQLNLLYNFSSVYLVVSGTIASGVTLSPVVLGIISGSGVLLNTYSEIKIYKKKIEPCSFSYTSSEKLVDLRSSLRGKSYDDQNYLARLKVFMISSLICVL